MSRQVGEGVLHAVARYTVVGADVYIMRYRR